MAAPPPSNYRPIPQYGRAPSTGYGGGPYPGSGGLAVVSLFSGQTSQESLWVLQNGSAWGTNSSGGVMQLAFPERVVGLFYGGPGTSAAWYGMGASGSFYATGNPASVAGSIPIKPTFCGAVRVNPLDQGVAYFAVGAGMEVFMQGYAADTFSWGRASLAQLKAGTPNVPITLDTGVKVYSSVAF